MTLRKTTLLITVLGSLALFFVLSTTTHLVVDASFGELETEEARRDMDRAQNALAEELDKLDSVVVDWAVWDDARNFILNGTDEFVTSNLNDRTLSSLRLAGLAYVNLKGEIVWCTACDPQRGANTPFQPELLALIRPGSPLLSSPGVDERVKGLVKLPQGIMLAVACPVTDSEAKSKPVGTLIMLRPLDQRTSTELAQRLRLPLSFEPSDRPLDADIAPLARQGEGKLILGALNSEIFCGMVTLRDLWDAPALRIVLRKTRDIRIQGDKILQHAQAWMAAGSALFLMLLLAFLDRRVLRRIIGLGRQVEAIGTGLTDSNRTVLGQVDIPGSDELSALARGMNAALSELERSRQRLSDQYSITSEQEGYLQQILDSIQAGVMLVDPDTHIIREVNSFAAKCSGYSREEIVGRLCHGFICPSEKGNCPVADLGLSGEQAVRKLLRADGSSISVLKSVSRIERGGVPLLLETFINVQELQLAQDALRNSEETYRAVFTHTGTASMLIQPDTTITLVNQEFEKLSGYTSDEIVGKHRWTEFFSPQDVDWMLRHHVKRRQSPDLAPRNYEAHFVNRRGEERTVLLTVGMMPGGEVSIASLEDITERKVAEEQLRHQAFHDALTGLPNRLLLLDRLERSIQSARREGNETAVLLMDLDRFKDINDSLGHPAGDALLRQVAERLNAAVRRSDTVARLGGDEFVLVVDGPAGEEAASLVARHVLDCFAQPFDLSGQSIYVRLSIGITMFPIHGDTPEELLKNADLAMYRAKERGRNTFDFFTKELNDLVVQRLAVETGLRRALTSGGLEVFYQPKVAHPGNALIGAEALVRWRREDGSLVPPAEFIPVAEDTGLIMPLSDLVLREACEKAVKWRREFSPDFVIAVNLSPRQFGQPGLDQRIREIMALTGAPAAALEFEITENLLMDTRPEIIHTLRNLREMGSAVVLDDFGKEYSSLSYIRKLPIQAIKIDRSFVDDLPGDEGDAGIVKSILDMAASLELRVVAEGVENPEQLAFLVQLGCVEFQGFYFSKPLPALDMEALLRQPDPFRSRA